MTDTTRHLLSWAPETYPHPFPCWRLAPSSRFPRYVRELQSEELLTDAVQTKHVYAVVRTAAGYRAVLCYGSGGRA